jgi:putative phosphoesterase
VRVAALSDIHGNLPALEAVLAEVEREQPDRIVICGDVVAGPMSVETLERVMALENALFVRGNADREAVEAWDEGRPFDPELDEHPARKNGAWVAEQISQEQRDFIAGFEDNVVLEVDGLGPVVFCHATPWDDLPIFTVLTPEERLRGLLAGVEQAVVVCGHTHMQFDRRLDGVRVVNAGSVGMPYEGRRGAFWTMLGPDVEAHCTEYDVERALERFRPYWDFEDLADQLLNPRQPREIAEFFENAVAEGKGAG